MLQIKSKFSETKLVTITRNDFKNFGYTLPQTAHTIADFAYEYPDEFKSWKETSNSIICLGCNSQEELIKLYNKFSQLTPTIKFFEPDVDEFTSICLLGTPDVRKKLAHLPLLKPKNNN